MMPSIEQKIQDKSAVIGIIGLGYVGLPLARAFIDASYRVIGFDVSQEKVNHLLAGKSYIGHLSSEWIARCVDEKRFEPTTEMQRLNEPDAILICVPTPLSESRDPDLSYVRQTAKMIAKRLRPGQIVVLESTTYPGTTRDVMLPILAKSGLVCGKDFFLAYSPEREDPGNPDFTAGGIPKVVGGNDEMSLRIAVNLYADAVHEVIPVSSCEVAEGCKVLENTYRAVNIALVNELKKIFDQLQIDVWEVIEAAKTKPFGFQAFYPGPGLGGHCIPIDPFYLSWVARKHGMATRFIELAGEVNASMPDYVLAKIAQSLNDVGKPVRGSKIALLGIAYKRDVDDPRESPSFILLERLLAQGAHITYNDPYVPHLPSMRAHDLPEMSSNELTAEYIEAQDCVLIATDHSCYDYDFIVKHARLVIDTRNATKRVDDPEGTIVKA